MCCWFCSLWEVEDCRLFRPLLLLPNNMCKQAYLGDNFLKVKFLDRRRCAFLKSPNCSPRGSPQFTLPVLDSCTIPACDQVLSLLTSPLVPLARPPFRATVGTSRRPTQPCFRPFCDSPPKYPPYQPPHRERERFVSNSHSPGLELSGDPTVTRHCAVSQQFTSDLLLKTDESSCKGTPGSPFGLPREVSLRLGFQGKYCLYRW